MSKALSSLAVGATIEVPVKAAFQSYLGKTVVFKVADKNHSGYPANSVTLITDKIPFLLAFDAIEASNSDSNRRSYGNNRYSLANLLQWLNSNAAAGKWYSAKHSADAPPTAANVWSSHNPYSVKAGFPAVNDGNGGKKHRYRRRELRNRKGENAPSVNYGSRACKRKQHCRRREAGLVF